MLKRVTLDLMRFTASKHPFVPTALSVKARYLVGCGKPDMSVKDYDEIVSRMTNMIQAVYHGVLGGEFIDAMAALISRQMYLACQDAWDIEGAGEDGEPLPDYLKELADDAAVNQVDFVDGLYRDIVDAKVDEAPIGDILYRVEMWATRYTETYNAAVTKIVSENGGKLKWSIGATEKHCETCFALDGLVAFASEWEASGIKPQNAPNDVLECGGWLCDCSLSPTDERRTRNAMSKLEEISTRTLL